jgi:rhodanese-related sulfurtransferase/rubrerythrin
MTSSEQPSGLEVMFPDDAAEFISQHAEGTYTLLDVRQPPEYEEEHLPGAKLVPLPELVDSLEGLEAEKPIIVYCAVGGRSRMAAQLLVNKDFKKVFYLEGGMQAWEGPAAEGPREFHLQFVRGDETPEEIIELSYGMEMGLKTFHEAVRSRTTDPELVELLAHLIRAEESHMRRLLEVSKKWGMEPDEIGAFKENLESRVMEGGIDIDKFLAKNDSFLQTVTGAIDVAMMVETQALDLYLRMAAESSNVATKEVLFHIAEEEKAHLRALGRALEEHLGKPVPTLS